MYEDDPQDKVFDVLGEAVFGAHPLGRAIIGRADVVGSAGPRRAARLPRRALRARQRRRGGGRLGRPRRARRARRARGHRARGRPPRRPSPRRPNGASAARRRFFAKETEQYHVCLGAPGLARDDERRFALRVLDDDPRRHVVLAALPGGAREARAGLQRLLLPGRVRGHGADRALPRHAPGQRRDGAAASSPTSSSASARSPAAAEELASGPRRTSRAASCSRWSRPRRA